MSVKSMTKRKDERRREIKVLIVVDYKYLYSHKDFNYVINEVFDFLIG